MSSNSSLFDVTLSLGLMPLREALAASCCSRWSGYPVEAAAEAILRRLMNEGEEMDEGEGESVLQCWLLVLFPGTELTLPVGVVLLVETLGDLA